MRTIEISDLTKRFGGVLAVDALDLTVAAGESVVILGPSGCGKSTTLKLVAGLEDPDAGDVRIDGTSQLGRRPHERDVAIVFQEYALYPHLTVERNITVGLRYGLGLPRGEATRRARDITRRLGIEELLARKPRELSGGQRQRVALGRALARHAGVVLLDEPLSGLDAQLRAELRVEIAALLRSSGATTIHVTHDQLDAMATADRVVVMREGRSVQVGTPEELYRRPGSLFVASFFGTPAMNLFPGSIQSGVLCVEGFTTAHVVGPDAPALVAGARPEDLQLGADGPLRGEGLVVLSELAGSSWYVHVEVAGRTVAVEHQGSPPETGSRVAISADPASVHLFSAESGLRLNRTAHVHR